MTSAATADVDALAEALRASAENAQVTTFQVLVEASGYILSEMERRVPVDSGNLRDSLGVKVDGDRVIIGPDAAKAPYAKYVEFGTAPHEIKPKNPGGVLAFKVNGVTVFAKSVKHPGTKPNPFIRDSFQQWVDSLGTMAAEANIKVIEDGAKS